MKSETRNPIPQNSTPKITPQTHPQSRLTKADAHATRPGYTSTRVGHTKSCVDTLTLVLDTRARVLHTLTRILIRVSGVEYPQTSPQKLTPKLTRSKLMPAPPADILPPAPLNALSAATRTGPASGRIKGSSVRLAFSVAAARPLTGEGASLSEPWYRGS